MKAFDYIINLPKFFSQSNFIRKFLLKGPNNAICSCRKSKLYSRLFRRKRGSRTRRFAYNLYLFSLGKWIICWNIQQFVNLLEIIIMCVLSDLWLGEMKENLLKYVLFELCQYLCCGWKTLKEFRIFGEEIVRAYEFYIDGMFFYVLG